MQLLVTTGLRNKEGFENVPHLGAFARVAENDSVRNAAKGFRLPLAESNQPDPHLSVGEYFAENDSVRGTRAAPADHESLPEGTSEHIQVVVQKSERLLRGSLGQSEPASPRHVWFVPAVIFVNAMLVAALRRHAQRS